LGSEKAQVVSIFSIPFCIIIGQALLIRAKVFFLSSLEGNLFLDLGHHPPQASAISSSAIHRFFGYSFLQNLLIISSIFAGRKLSNAETSFISLRVTPRFFLFHLVSYFHCHSR
jgi:hypothetical protein